MSVTKVSGAIVIEAISFGDEIYTKFVFMIYYIPLWIEYNSKFKMILKIYVSC